MNIWVRKHLLYLCRNQVGVGFCKSDKIICVHYCIYSFIAQKGNFYKAGFTEGNHESSF